jgi:prevent-host-death family protein
LKFKTAKSLAMAESKNVDSLSNFKRRTPGFIARMKKTGQPIVLTVKGKPEVVVQDAASYRRMQSMAERGAQELLREQP